jgi:hypothetical protein
MINCLSFSPQKIFMPKCKGETKPVLEFKNHKHSLKRGFVGYCDFECLMCKEQSFVSEKNKLSVEDDDSHPFTNYCFKHEPSGYCYVVIDERGNIFKKELYRGKNCVKKLINSLENTANSAFESYIFYKEMQLSIEDEKNFSLSDSCHICKVKYTKTDVRVRDHCHLSGKYRGSAHQSCNIRFSHDSVLPIFLRTMTATYFCMVLQSTKRN